MARLVGAIGAPHSPMLGIDPAGWVSHGDIERDRLLASDLPRTSRSESDLVEELDAEIMAARSERLQVALRDLADRLGHMQPDVLLIVGDDQRELFLDDGMPAITVFWGSTLWDRPPGADAYPPTMADAYRWYHADSEEAYDSSAELGLHLVTHLMQAGFDVAQFSEQSKTRSLGHAFTFIYRRLVGDRSIPLVPVMLNTYYPPNQPSPARCIALGEALARAVGTWDVDARVVLVASGGLSHPIIDEELDRRLLDSLERHDLADLTELPSELLREGSSEIRNWLTVGGAMNGSRVEVLDYVPAYRSMLGSGCGMGFVVWHVDA